MTRAMQQAHVISAADADLRPSLADVTVGGRLRYAPLSFGTACLTEPGRYHPEMVNMDRSGASMSGS